MEGIQWKDRFDRDTGQFDLPEGVTRIDDYAFDRCIAENRAIVIPEQITEIGAYAFRDCRISAVMFPSGLTRIGASAFHYCGYLSSVTIPGSVQCVDSGAFEYCYDLKAVVVQEGVKRIGKRAFYDSYHLASVSLPSSVEEIGEDAFAECPNVRICGFAGTYAKRYADENGIPFQLYVPKADREKRALNAHGGRPAARDMNQQPDCIEQAAPAPEEEPVIHVTSGRDKIKVEVHWPDGKETEATWFRNKKVQTVITAPRKKKLAECSYYEPPSFS